MKFWYFTEGNKADSSYTDFTSMNNEPVSSYTDFTMAASSPVLNRSVRKAKVRNFKGSGKKSSAGKVLAGFFAVIAVLLAVALGAMYYMTDNGDGGIFCTADGNLAKQGLAARDYKLLQLVYTPIQLDRTLF